MKVLFAFALVVAGASTAQSQAQGNWVSIVNDKDSTIVELYASKQKESYWGPNWFGESVLRAYGDVAINLDNNAEDCIWDLKAVYSNGYEVTQMGVNVCETRSWRVF